MQNVLTIKSILLFVCLLSGCKDCGCYDGYNVEVIKPADQHDRYTIVKFPDGSRARKHGWWGHKGDKFFACKEAHRDYWCQP